MPNISFLFLVLLIVTARASICICFYENHPYGSDIQLVNGVS